MNDFIIHIHLYLTDRESENTAYQNLKKLKECGFKILITSPKILPEYLYEFVDYFCHDKENQLLVEEYEGIEPTVLWLNTGNTELRFVVRKLQRHGLAVLRAMIKGCRLASMHGYKYVIRFEYDDCFGMESMKLIEETAKRLTEDKYDFHVYKNTYVGVRNDVSVHLMYYECNKFLEIFGSITDEQTYNEYLVQLGHPKQGLILEQFLLLMLEKTSVNANILYDTGENLISSYHDTVFNKHQSDPGVKDGVLSDVMVSKLNGNLIPDQVYLGAHNFSSENTQTVYYDVFGMNDELIHTYFFVLEKRQWQYIPISLSNVKTIKIKHNSSDYHKIFTVEPMTKNIKYFEDDIQQTMLSEAWTKQ